MDPGFSETALSNGLNQKGGNQGFRVHVNSRPKSTCVDSMPGSTWMAYQSVQKSLNRSGASSVYLTVCCMFLCPR